MKRGTIILTPFPFTDLHGNKIRPALFISNDNRSGEDIIIAFISSVIDFQNLQPTDLLLTESDPGFSDSGLKGSSVFKLDKITTIHKKIVLGELGNLTKSLMGKVNDKLKIALALN